MALNNLERFVAVARNPLALGSLFERDREALPMLLQIFATSQHLSDLLITDRESYDLLRLTEGQPVSREDAGRRAGRRGRSALGDDEPAVLRPCGASSAAKRCASPTATSSAASRWKPSPRRSRTWPTRSSKRPLRGGWQEARQTPRHAQRTATADPAGSSCWPWASWAASN